MAGQRVTKAESELRIEEMVGFLIIGLSRAEIIRFVTTGPENPWIISKRQIDKYMRKATDRITESSQIDLEREIGLAIRRLENLYKRTLNTQDFKTALAVQKERHELLGLKNNKLDVNLTGEVKHEHGITPEDAKNIFTILEESGAFKAFTPSTPSE